MLILDTDVLTIIQRRQGALYDRVVAAIAPFEDDVAITIISFEEQLRGWLALIAKSKRITQQLIAYQRLLELLEDFRSRLVLPFESGSADIFEELRRTHRRHGAMDLKIASVALANDAAIATRNVTDFADIEGLRIIDPTK